MNDVVKESRQIAGISPKLALALPDHHPIHGACCWAARLHWQLTQLVASWTEADFCRVTKKQPEELAKEMASETCSGVPGAYQLTERMKLQKKKRKTWSEWHTFVASSSIANCKMNDLRKPAFRFAIQIILGFCHSH